MQGEFFLRFTNIHTQEVREVNIKNTVTIEGDYSSITFNQASRTTTYWMRQIWITDIKSVASNKAYAGTLRASAIMANSREEEWTLYEGNPTYVQTRQRFNTPPVGTTREINTIIVGEDIPSDASGIFAYASLSAPCFQQDFEVLDVVYRIQVFDERLGLAGAHVANDAYKVLASWVRFPVNGQFPATPNTGWISSFPADNAGDIDRYIYITTNNSSFSDQRVSSLIHNNASGAVKPVWKLEASTNFAEASKVGFPIRSLLYTANTSTVYEQSTPIVASDFVDSTYAYQPVQVIHNHSSNATKPFVDVDNLASGQGTLAVNGDSWEGLRAPIYQWSMLDIANTGDVGTARYSYRMTFRGLTNGNTYMPWPRYTCQFSSKYASYPVTVDDTSGWVVSSERFHGLRIPSNIEAWIDDKHVVRWDATGISLHDLANDVATHFDASSTPALPVTSLRQVDVADDGTLWAACRSTGLWRIQDPLGTPIVTNVPNTNGNTTGSSCFAVAVGYQGKIWAVWDGAISSTADGGTTWVDYAPGLANKFFHNQAGASGTDITTSWSKVDYIRADRSADTDDIVILYEHAPTSTDIRGIPWRPSEGMSRPEMEKRVYGRHPITYLPKINAFRCSRKGGMWVRTEDLGSGFYTMYQHVFRTFDKLSDYQNYRLPTFNTVSTNAHRPTGPAFMYASNGSVMAAISSFNNSYQHSALVKVDGVPRHWVSNGAYTANNTQMFHCLGLESGEHNVCLGASAVIDHSALTILPPVVSEVDNTLGLSFDAKNVSGEITEDAFWTQYRWNPNTLQWVKNYCADLVDTLALNHGKRKGFKTESHEFCGTSIVEVPNVLTGLTEFTFATVISSITPHAAYHEDRQALFGSQNCGLIYDAGTSEIYFMESFLPDNPTEDVFLINKSAAASVLLAPNDRLVVTLSEVDSATIDIYSKWCNSTTERTYKPIALGSTIRYERATTATATSSTYTRSGFNTPFINGTQNGHYKIRFTPDIGTLTSFRMMFEMSYSGIVEPHRISNTAYRTTDDGIISIDMRNNAIYINDVSSGIPISLSDYQGGQELEIEVQLNGVNVDITVRKTAGATLGTYTVTNRTKLAGLKCRLVHKWYSAETSNVGDTVMTINNLQILDASAADADITPKSSSTYQLDVYHNGTNILSTQVNSQYKTKILSGDLYIGASRMHRIENTYAHFRGTFDNTQVWGRAWSAAEIAEDMLNPTGVISNTANMLAHYQYPSLSGQETKPTHSSAETLPTGLTVSFADGGTSPAFVGGDNYTFGVMDGVLKDNAVSFDYDINLFMKPLELTHTEFQSGATQTTTIPTYSNSETSEYEYAILYPTSGSSSALVHPGSAQTRKADLTFYEYRTLSGDFSVQFTPAHNHGYIVVALMPTHGTAISFPSMTAAAPAGRFYIAFAPDGTQKHSTFNVQSPSGLQAQDVPYVPGDTIEIVRTGGTIQVTVNGTSVASIPDSELAPTLYLGAYLDEFGAITNCKIKTQRNISPLVLGNSATNKGAFSKEFIQLEGVLKLWDVTIGGVAPAAINFVDAYGATQDSLVEPAPGEMTVVLQTGWLLFNSADAGKTFAATKLPAVFHRKQS